MCDSFGMAPNGHPEALDRSHSKRESSAEDGSENRSFLIRRTIKRQPLRAALTFYFHFYWEAGFLRAGGFLVVLGAGLVRSNCPFSITIMKGFEV